MKKILLVFLLCNLYLISSSQLIKDRDYVHLEKKSYEQKMKFQPNGLSDNYDIVYHRIFWEVDPSQQFIKGSVTSYFKALQNNVNTLVFDLYNNLDVDSVLYGNDLLNHTHQNGLVNITLTNTLNQNELDSLTVYYHGTPSGSSGFGAFISSSHSGTPVMWTLSEPYGAADWWPCKQSLTDKIDSLDIYVKSNSAYKVASNGKLMSENVSNGFKTTHWKHRHPIVAYLVAIAVTNYAEFSDFAMVDEINSVEILNYVYPEDLTYAETAAEYTVGVMELFSELFIPYPFWDEKYGHAQFGWGGGMEHQTMSFMGGFSKGLIAHELAHQWFGDFVTCGSWHDIWVNEGFAVFCENLVYENLHPESWKAWKQSELSHLLNYATSGSVYVEDTSSINALFSSTLVYTKGGYILHLLRNQLGDEAFFAGIKEMLTNAKTANGFARAIDVQEYLEAAADTNLTAFFNDWYYGQGYPTYSINWYQREDNTIVIDIAQSQTHSSVGFFEMKVPILLKGNGTDKLIHLPNKQNNEHFEVALDFAVESIEFDPDLNILAPHPAIITTGIANEISKKDFSLSPNPVTNKLYINSSENVNISSYEVYNLSGKLLISVDQYIANGWIDVAGLPAGVYYVKFNTPSQSIAKQFVKAY